MTKKVTIHDVVKASGYGLGTVSRVLSGKPGVKESTRQKILKVIEELNYTPNVNGARLRQKHSGVIAVMVPVINHPFFARFVEEVESAATAKGYSILLVASQMNVEKERAILNKIKRKEVDGAIFVTHYEFADDDIHGYPLVSVDRHLNHSVPFVSSDNYDATKAAIEQFVKSGAKKIGYIGSKPFVDSEVLLREKAYLDVMKEHHLTPMIVNEVTEHGAEEALVDKFLEKYPDLDAIFASGNTFSEVVYSKLMAQGKRMPEDIQLIGYDGVFYNWNDIPRISSIQQPIKEMAVAAFNILVDLIENKKVKQVNVYKTTFIKGKTTK